MSRHFSPYPRFVLLLWLALSVFVLSNWTVTDAQTTTLYSFQSLDVPSAASTWPIGINNSGQVAGYYDDNADYNANRTHGFVYSRGTFTTLDPPGATYTMVTSINNSGQVVGHYSDDNKGHGFVYDDGAFTTLDVPGGIPNYTRNTSLSSINDSGQVVGDYYDIPNDPPGTRLILRHGFMYSNGAFIMLEVPGSSSTSPTSINASGQVAGSYYAGGSDGYAHSHGFVYSNGTFTTLDVAGATHTNAGNINASGQVIGTYVLDNPLGSNVYYGFVYSKGTFTTLDAVGATSTSLPYFTSPQGINTSGQVVGQYLSSAEFHGFLYSNGVFTTLDVPGAQYTYPRSINDNGQVTGSYYDGSNTHGFIATPMGTPTDIPTLSQWALLLGGLLLGGIAWRTLVGRTHSLRG